MSCRGLFLTFEGPEGSGKTTQSAMLAQRLEGAGHRVLAVREPGGTAVGEALRDVLLNHPGQPLNIRAETLIFTAARAQLVTEVIEPALDEGYVVLCDRFADSTLAYQGYGHYQDLSLLKPIIKYATGGLEPSQRILLDIPPVDGLARGLTEEQLAMQQLDKLVRLTEEQLAESMLLQLEKLARYLTEQLLVMQQRLAQMTQHLTEKQLAMQQQWYRLVQHLTEEQPATQFQLEDAGLREWNYMDALDLAFHQRVYEGYLELAEQNPERWLTVDAKGSPDAVHAQIWDGVSVLLPHAAEHA